MERDNILTRALDQNWLKELWDLSKDKIDICKVCEYRHMCVDPRIPVKRPDGTYFMEAECAYNPYLGKSVCVLHGHFF